MIIVAKICGHIRGGGLCREWPLREGEIIVFRKVHVDDSFKMGNMHLMSFVLAVFKFAGRPQTDTVF